MQENMGEFEINQKVGLFYNNKFIHGPFTLKEFDIKSKKWIATSGGSFTKNQIKLWPENVENPLAESEEENRVLMEEYYNKNAIRREREEEEAARIKAANNAAAVERLAKITLNDKWIRLQYEQENPPLTEEQLVRKRVLQEWLKTPAGIYAQDMYK